MSESCSASHVPSLLSYLTGKRSTRALSDSTDSGSQRKRVFIVSMGGGFFG